MPRRSAHKGRERRSAGDEGFTLIELLIVTAVIPLIVGALAAGLFAIFTLQTSTSSRIADSSDAQAVQASFETDVQVAQQVEISPTPACVSSNETGTQLLGMEWNLQPGEVTAGDLNPYDNVVSYVEVANGTQNNLVRQSCVLSGGVQTSETDTILSYDLPANENPATLTCVTWYTGSCPTTADASTSTWVSTSDVSNVAFNITEPDSKFNYALTAAPLSTATAADTGGPIHVNASTGCEFPQAGSGPLASSLCVIDFSNLLGNPTLLADAEVPEPGCLEESIALSGGFTLYFCLNITNSEAGEIIQPFALPTYCQAFLGNPGTSAACGSTGIYPNYYDIPGEPALYQQGTGGGVNDGYITTITMTGIEIVNGQGVPATGWELFSADAESTDAGSGTNNDLAESITWNASTDLSVISNGYTIGAGYCTAGTPCDTSTDPAGTACFAGKSWTFNGTTYYGIAANSTDTEDYYNAQGNPVTTNTVECTVPPTAADVTEEGTLTGALMVEAPAPSTFTATMGDGNGGLEAVVFGLLSS
ncbi:MAG: prepilin-type N-terminal cleavage/methylation domain-containing protein [Acidimicrobiales bacterium]